MSTLLLRDKAETSSGALAVAAGLCHLALHSHRCAAVCSTPLSPSLSPSASGGVLDALCKRLEELDERVQQLEVINRDTETNVVGICDRLDELEGVVAAQEKSFNQRLVDALSQLSVQNAESNAVVAELSAAVQSQGEQLQKLMEARETAVVEVQSASTAPAGALTRLSRAAAKAAGLS